MKAHDIDTVTRELDPAPAAGISESAWSEVSHGITTAAAAEQPVSLDARRRPFQPRSVVVAACGLLIAGTVVTAVAHRPSQDFPQALSVTESGDWLTVRVVDQDADPKAYNQQFKKLGLNIKVVMVPVSPSRVKDHSTFSYNVGSEGEKLRLLEPGENCPATLDQSNPACQHGVEVNKSFRGKAEIEFGRVAKPGEMYQTSPGESNAPGEELAGVSYRNDRVSDVQKLLASRGMSVGSYLNSKTELVKGVATAKEVNPAPGDWYVHSIQPHSPGSVLVWIGPEPEN